MAASKKILVTGATGQIAYSLLFRLASGELFGASQEIDLHLYDLPEMEGGLKGVKMELEDSCFPELRSIIIGTDFEKAAEGIDLAFMLGAKPRGAGMERKDLLGENSKIFVQQGKGLNKAAKKEALILVVGNPCNTNALICLDNAPNLSPKQFFAMTMLDQLRGECALAEHLKARPQDIEGFTIFGNHSNNLVPDYTHARFMQKSLLEAIPDEKWLQGPFCEKVQKRGAEIIAARGKSSAASAASAAIRQMRSILFSDPQERSFSAGVFSEKNPYGIDPALIYSFPIIADGNGRWRYKKFDRLSPWLSEKMAISEKELIEERNLVRSK
jgi:malate dehydrogenase